MKLSDFKYPLPRNLVAKYPASPRDHSRLMVLNRADETIEDRHFSDIANIKHNKAIVEVNFSLFVQK